MANVDRTVFCRTILRKCITALQIFSLSKQQSLPVSTCATIFLLLSEQGNTPQPASTADFSREGKILHNVQWKPAHLAGFTCFNGSIYPHVQGFTAFWGGKSPQLRSDCPPTGKVMRRFCLLPKMPASCPRNALVYLQCSSWLHAFKDMTYTPKSR